MAILNPYLSFQDTTRDAMEFYQSVLGGELVITTFGEFGAEDAALATLVMHSSLTTPSGFTLFAADTPPGMEFEAGSQITVSLSGPLADEAELRGYWEALAADGAVHVPLEKQMWGDVFGQLVDRFGIGWLVDIGQE